MAPSTERIRIKVQRAQQHIRDLEAAIGVFFAAKPYLVGTRRDPESRRLIYYVTSVRDVPDRISAIAGDVLQNLRSALDHLAYALFMVGPGGMSGSPAKHVYFPIADDAAKYAAEAPGKIKGVRKDARDAINAIKPYKGGNDTLWTLHKLNNIDKHRFVIMVGSACHSVDLGAHISAMSRKSFPHLAAMPTLHAFFKPEDQMFPLKVGDELLIDAPDAEMNQEMQFRFEVAFGEPGIVDGVPLVDTLQGMADVVDNVVTDFAPFFT